MRIGFITQLLWSRYGDFWVRLMEELDAEMYFASKEQSLKLLRDERLESIPALSFKLAVVQSLALSQVDILVVPELNWGEQGQKASGQDPWIANFPEALASQVSGLPPVLAVPASLEPDIESLVITKLMQLSRDPSKVRRAWERHRGRLRMPHVAEPRWQKRASEKEVLGLIHQPWLDVQDYLGLADTSHCVSQASLDPGLLREEGKRLDPKLILTDQEVVGAARLMARRGGIDRLIFVADKYAQADLGLYERVKKLVHKPLELRYLQELIEPENLFFSL